MTSAGAPAAGVRGASPTGPLRHRLSQGIVLLAGCVVSTSCYAVTIRAGLGLGPLYAVQQGFALRTGMSIGHAVMVTGVATVAVALALKVRPGPGTLVLPFAGGALLDAVLPAVPAVHGLLWRLVAVAAASWLMALGGALTIRASAGVAAYDAVMLGLRRILGAPLAPVRLGMEATMLVTGWLIGGAIGVGTVMTGVLIGPGIQFWLRVLDRLAARPAMVAG